MKANDRGAQQRPSRVAKVLLAGAAGLVVLGVGLPRVSGAAWAEVGSALEGVSAAEFAALTAVWLVGLWVHTVALAAAMPGLSRSRAFYLNLSGSAVSNLVPFGGAAGTLVNYWNCSRWGFSLEAFLRWALVTNFWDTGLKLLLPGVALSWLAVAGNGHGAGLVVAGVGGLLLLAVYLELGWLLLTRPGGARALAFAADRLARRLGHEPPTADAYAARAASFRRATADLLRTAYRPLTVGKLAYAAVHAVLLWTCLAATGYAAAPAVAFAAFTVERLISLAAITPGGSGLVEVGTVGALVGLGVPGVAAAAGVLLYRAFVFAMEIPLGATLLGASLLTSRTHPAAHSRRRPRL